MIKIRSKDQFDRVFFPKAYHKRKIRKLIREGKFGEHLGKKTIEKIKEMLKDE